MSKIDPQYSGHASICAASWKDIKLEAEDGIPIPAHVFYDVLTVLAKEMHLQLLFDIEADTIVFRQNGGGGGDMMVELKKFEEQEEVEIKVVKRAPGLTINHFNAKWKYTSNNFIWSLRGVLAKAFFNC